MQRPRRRTLSRFVVTVLLAGLACCDAGCAAWLKDTSAADVWDSMTPNQETWDKLNPANLFYSLKPSQLDKLNRGPGMSSDVYYSVSDPISPEPAVALPSRAAAQIDEPLAANRWRGFVSQESHSASAISGPAP